jgi:hypothetical protein
VFPKFLPELALMKADQSGLAAESRPCEQEKVIFPPSPSDGNLLLAIDHMDR